MLIINWLNQFFLPEDAEIAFRNAQQYINNEDYDTALMEIKKAIASKDDFPDFHFLEGLCYYNKGLYTNAVISYKRAINLKKDFREVYYNLGLAFCSLNKFDESIENIRKAINMGYQEFFVYDSLGYSYQLNKEFEKAIAQYNISISKNISNFKSYKNLGDIYFINKDYKRALEFYQNAISINSEYQEGYIGIAKVYTEIGKYDKAIKNLKESIEFDSKNFYPYWYLGKVYSYKKDFEEAIHFFRKAIKLNTKTIEVYIDLGINYRNLGDFNKAVKVFNESLLLKKDWINIYFELGYTYYLESSIKDIEKAINYFQKVLAQENNHSLALYYIGLCYQEKNEHEKAINYFEKILNIPNNYETKIFKAKAFSYLEINNNETAIEILKLALQNTIHQEEIEKINILLEKAYLNKDKIFKESNDFYNENDNLLQTIQDLQIKLRKHDLLKDLSFKVTDIIDSFNKPLVVTVMGEFKVGKSTFINALIGKNIAPMGVTPTTATINFFQYGTRNKIKVIWNDGSEPETVRIDKLSEYVDERKVNKQEIENIKLVEIYYDWDTLRDISVVDTPGLNVGIKLHEETTKNFVEKSDAIIWLFDVEQAGKASERKMLEYIKQFSQKTVGVINAIDKVSKDEFDEVLEYLKIEFENYISEIIGVSSKLALKSKLDNDLGLIEKSNFGNLEKFLNDNIYTKSYQIKQKSVIHRLQNIILETNEIIENYKSKNIKTLDKINELRLVISNLKDEFNNIFIPNEIKNFKESIFEIYKTSANSAKEFIKRSDGFFSKNEVTIQDKNFFQNLIQNNTIQLLEKFEAKIYEKIQELSKTFSENLDKFFKFYFDDSKEENRYFLLFIGYHEGKLKELNKVLLGNYYYYKGFIDSGSLNNFFGNLEGKDFAYMELSTDILVERIIKCLPDIIPNINNSLEVWTSEYFTLLENLCNIIEKDIKDSYIDNYQGIFRPIELFYDRFKDVN